jgi:NAD(P)-dependent dehydrogenase (short-subunit alcohol dehydrogenase family)
MTRRFLVTGATDGIGKQTAIELARGGGHVILHGRSEERLDRARADVLAAAPGASLDVARADLASLAEVRALAADLGRRFERLDALVHNAGVFATERTLTADGLELSYAVNHFAPYLLTHLVLELLRASDDGRVVLVSSVAHARGRVDVDDLTMERRFDGYAAYAASKLASVLFALEMARRLGPTPTINALHPGVVSTKLLRTGFNMEGPDSLAKGAATSVYLATSDEVRGTTGRYFAACKPAATSAAGRDAATAKRLYEASAAIVGVPPLPEP